MSDIISPDTNLDLRQVTERHAESIANPFYARVGGFASAYAGIEAPVAKTLITGQPDSLAITVDSDTEHKFINIDIPAQGPAIIVRPGPDSTGEFARSKVRALTEAEGRALVADIHQIIADAPANRKHP